MKLNIILIFIFLGFFIFSSGERLWNHFSLEGTTVQLPSELPRKPIALVFWASWCGPCTVELARINRLVQNNSLDKDSILAVSLDEDLKAANEAVVERGYTFPVVYDSKGLWSREFDVRVTPTIIILDEKRKVLWATSGLSPLLEVKLKYYISGSPL